MGKLGVGAGLPFVTCSKPTPIRCAFWWVWVGMFNGFGGFFITAIPAKTKHCNFTFTVYTLKNFLLSTQLSVHHPMAPVQSTLKRR